MSNERTRCICTCSLERGRGERRGYWASAKSIAVFAMAIVTGYTEEYEDLEPPLSNELSDASINHGNGKLDLIAADFSESSIGTLNLREAKVKLKNYSLSANGNPRTSGNSTSRREPRRQRKQSTGNNCAPLLPRGSLTSSNIAGNHGNQGDKFPIVPGFLTEAPTVDWVHLSARKQPPVCSVNFEPIVANETCTIIAMPGYSYQVSAYRTQYAYGVRLITMSIITQYIHYNIYITSKQFGLLSENLHNFVLKPSILKEEILDYIYIYIYIYIIRIYRN